MKMGIRKTKKKIQLYFAKLTLRTAQWQHQFTDDRVLQPRWLLVRTVFTSKTSRVYFS